MTRTATEYTCKRCQKALPLNEHPHRLDAIALDRVSWSRLHKHHCADGREWVNEGVELPPAKEVFVHALVWLVRWMGGDRP